MPRDHNKSRSRRAILAIRNLIMLVLVAAASLIWGNGRGADSDRAIPTVRFPRVHHVPRAPHFNNFDPRPILTAGDVQSVVQRAAESLDSTAMVIAVTDRQGDVLALYRKPGAPPTAVGNFSMMVDTNELAVALARTASFFSNNQAPLSTRTVRFISGIHFPPGIPFTPNAALYGIENTNRGCPVNADFIPGQEVPPARTIDRTRPGLGIITGKADLNDSDSNAVNPGGVPLFKQGQLVGGVGVAGVSPNLVEYAAFSGAARAGFEPSPAPPEVVIIDGLALPFVDQKAQPAGTGPGAFDAANFLIPPRGSPKPAPEGDLVAPKAGPLGGLTAEEVRHIIDAAVATADQTRGVIRLPLGSRARMAIAVADLDGTILALHRMPDATIFSIDVAVAKSRNVIYFSSAQRRPEDLPGVPMGTAVNNRTISFGAQPLFPPGINFSQPGPFFDLYKWDTANPCTQGFQAPNSNQSGIVFFPGSLPLYRNAVLVGGLGVSGDGVEQDDFVTAGAAQGLDAPESIRADQIIIRGVRLPYLKFPRNPTQ
ncbi:MAG: heme-binding protein [Acidobacteria bacterium]|nr:heme-binding protein [Acidobacteriota bacterium]